MNIASGLKQVWMADDDDDDIMVFEAALHEISSHTDITVFTCVKDVLDALGSKVPDLLFLDINMPGITGNECLQTIRKNPAWAALPVVVQSSSNYSPDVQASYRCGASLYVVKPQTFQELSSTLQIILQLDWKEYEKISQIHFVNGRFVPFSMERIHLLLQ